MKWALCHVHVSKRASFEHFIIDYLVTVNNSGIIHNSWALFNELVNLEFKLGYYIRIQPVLLACLFIKFYAYQYSEKCNFIIIKIMGPYIRNKPINEASH